MEVIAFGLLMLISFAVTSPIDPDISKPPKAQRNRQLKGRAFRGQYSQDGSYKVHLRLLTDEEPSSSITPDTPDRVGSGRQYLAKQNTDEKIVNIENVTTSNAPPTRDPDIIPVTLLPDNGDSATDLVNNSTSSSKKPEINSSSASEPSSLSEIPHTTEPIGVDDKNLTVIDKNCDGCFEKNSSLAPDPSSAGFPPLVRSPDSQVIPVILLPPSEINSAQEPTSNRTAETIGLPKSSNESQLLATKTYDPLVPGKTCRSCSQSDANIVPDLNSTPYQPETDSQSIPVVLVFPSVTDSVKEPSSKAVEHTENISCGGNTETISSCGKKCERCSEMNNDLEPASNSFPEHVLESGQPGEFISVIPVTLIEPPPLPKIPAENTLVISNANNIKCSSCSGIDSYLGPGLNSDNQVIAVNLVFDSEPQKTAPVTPRSVKSGHDGQLISVEINQYDKNTSPESEPTQNGSYTTIKPVVFDLSYGIVPAGFEGQYGLGNIKEIKNYNSDKREDVISRLVESPYEAVPGGSDKSATLPLKDGEPYGHEPFIQGEYIPADKPEVTDQFADVLCGPASYSFSSEGQYFPDNNEKLYDDGSDKAREKFDDGLYKLKEEKFDNGLYQQRNLEGQFDDGLYRPEELARKFDDGLVKV